MPPFSTQRSMVCTSMATMACRAAKGIISLGMSPAARPARCQIAASISGTSSVRYGSMTLSTVEVRRSRSGVW